MPQTPLGKFTVAGAQKIVDFIDAANNAPTDNTGSRSIRRSFSNRFFWAKITCYCSLTVNQWKYSFIEMQRTKDGWTPRENGRAGDCCGDTYAINAVEAYNGESDINGNSQGESSGEYLLPVRGEPIVLMQMSFPLTEASGNGDSGDGSGGDSTGATQPTLKAPVYSFQYENAEAFSAPANETCGCTASSATSSPTSDQFYCIFAWTCVYDCDASSGGGAWGSVQKSGNNCQIPPATLGGWIRAASSNPNKPVYIYYAQGAPCSGPEHTSPCQTFPPTPAAPTFTPPCGSSSITSSSEETFVCVYAYTSFYDCDTATWSTPTKDGLNCQAAPSIVNSWVGSHTVAYWFSVGGPCAGPEQVAACSTTWPDPPDVAPSWTPNCSTSSERSSSSESITSSSDNPCAGRTRQTATVPYVSAWDADTCTVTMGNLHFCNGLFTGVS